MNQVFMWPSVKLRTKLYCHFIISVKMKKICSHFRTILKDYCLNSSLAGLSYIADDRYHLTERLFWLACVILSWIGSFNLIMTFMDSYVNNSVSMGVISLRPIDEVAFPSAGICEMGYTKEEYKQLEQIIEEMKVEVEKDRDGSVEYNYDVEDFLMRVIFHNLYNFGSMTSYCTPYSDCDDCIKCPETGYQKFADRVRANCTSLFRGCKWNDKPFECCDFFKPIRTTLGTCFLLNSIQAVKKHGKNWLDMTVSMKHGNGKLELTVSKSSALYILDEEDIPHMLLTTLQFPQIPDGFDGELLLSIQDTVNEKNVRSIDSLRRKCIFPDEPTDSAYKRYSYSTCVTDCLKKAQIVACNCTHYNMIVDEHDKSPECDFKGLSCLDKLDLMFPQTTIMQPWRTDGLVCMCLPSCTEPQINVVGRSSEIRDNTNLRKVTVKLQQVPSQRYFRQAVREQIDIVGESNDQLKLVIRLKFGNCSVGWRNSRTIFGSKYFKSRRVHLLFHNPIVSTTLDNQGINRLNMISSYDTFHALLTSK